MQQRLSGVDGEFSLAWLLRPLTVEDFLNNLWGTTHYQVNRNCPGYFDTLLDRPASLDELLAFLRPDRSLVRLVRENDTKDPYVYRLADGGFDIAGVGKDFADGYTIVLGNVQRHVHAIASLSHSIEVELNFATQVNAYVTPPESRGFVTHYDDHDALIAQIRGSKRWYVYDGADVAPQTMRRQEPVVAAALPVAHRTAPGGRRRALPAPRPSPRRRSIFGVIGPLDRRPARAHATHACHPST